MRTRRAVIIAFLAVLATLATLVVQAPAHAVEVGSKRLIENAKFYDGRTITYKGEAVTAIMKRGAYAWINVNDGDNAIGVWCKRDVLEGVTFLGNYKTKGDILLIEGIFNRACQEHGGDLDIHADTVTVQKQGRAVSETVNRKKVRYAVLLFFLTLMIVMLFRKRI